MSRPRRDPRVAELEGRRSPSSHILSAPPPMSTPESSHLCWLNFVLTFFFFWLTFGKLWEARPRLYRRKILQINTRLKALARFTHFCTFGIQLKNHEKRFLHRSDLNIWIFRKNSSNCFRIFARISAKVLIFRQFSSNFAQIFMIFFGISPNILENVEKS